MSHSPPRDTPATPWTETELCVRHHLCVDCTMSIVREKAHFHCAMVVKLRRHGVVFLANTYQPQRDVVTTSQSQPLHLRQSSKSSSSNRKNCKSWSFATTLTIEEAGFLRPHSFSLPLSSYTCHLDAYHSQDVQLSENYICSCCP